MSKTTGLCSLFQRYKLKAIHNHLLQLLQILQTVFIISKIQIESYSQLIKSLKGEILTVFIISKIQIESYSQPDTIDVDFEDNCVHYFKDTN